MLPIDHTQTYYRRGDVLNMSRYNVMSTRVSRSFDAVLTEIKSFWGDDLVETYNSGTSVVMTVRGPDGRNERSHLIQYTLVQQETTITRLYIIDRFSYDR